MSGKRCEYGGVLFWLESGYTKAKRSAFFFSGIIQRAFGLAAVMSYSLNILSFVFASHLVQSNDYSKPMSRW